MRSGNKEVEVLVTIGAIHDRYMVVKDGDREINVPRPHVKYDETAKVGDEVVMIMPELLAMRAGLV